MQARLATLLLHCGLTLDVWLGGINTFKGRDAEGRCLARAIFGSRQDVPALQGDRYALLLDWRGLLEALLIDASEQLAFQEEVLELAAFGVEDVLHGVRTARNNFS